MGKKDKHRPKVKAKKKPAGSDKYDDLPKEIAVFDPDQVEKVLDAMPDREALTRAADRLQGLAHPSRLQALLALAVSELCVGDVAAVLGLSLSATSTMLKQLRSLGYVATRHAGKQTYYRATSRAPQAVLDVVLAPDARTA
jgi:ArsR family transcriptional regulator, lead/cadmium/zinc/bismuth-responsive transcriptional repressor